jgi:hypothetical protein
MKLTYLLLPLVLLTACSGGAQFSDDTFTKVVEIIKLTHYDQRVALEQIIGFNLDMNSDGVVDKAEKETVVANVIALLAADPVKRDALMQLWATPRFKVWLGAVAGDLALDKIEKAVAASKAE